MWVLGIETEFFKRGADAPNHSAISSVLESFSFKSRMMAILYSVSKVKHIVLHISICFINIAKEGLKLILEKEENYFRGNLEIAQGSVTG